MKDLWTISQLSAETALALSRLELGQDSGRVSEAPSSRTIRYYTTHGLLDRPAAFKGRTALYGPRHLLQLLAIKRLQSKGRTLVDIQNMLLGATDDELRVFADVFEHQTIAGKEVAATSKDTLRKDSGLHKRSLDFWKSREKNKSEIAEGSFHSHSSKGEGRDGLSQVLPTIKLAEGAFLVLDTTDLYTSDIESIRAAAEPLIALLQQRRILRPKQ